MLSRAHNLHGILLKTKRDQHLIGHETSNQVKIEIWSEIHEAQLSACISILQNEAATHAICEVRERKRNSTLGLLPTISELAELISMIQDEPEQQTLDANPPNFTQAEIEAKTPIR
jgi:Mg/Co/Ni transporter MgtE